MANVLVIDDNHLVLDTLELLLGQAGISALTASSAEQALKVLGSNSFDLALCDIQMPKDRSDLKMEGGIFMITHLRSKFPSCKVLAMSGDCSDELSRQIEGLGALKLLQKPFGAEDIVRIIKESLTQL